MGEHDKALKILVHNMEDFAAAEAYIDQISNDERLTEKLLYDLMSVYLDPSLEYV